MPVDHSKLRATRNSEKIRQGIRASIHDDPDFAPGRPAKHEATRDPSVLRRAFEDLKHQHPGWSGRRIRGKMAEHFGVPYSTIYYHTRE